MKKILFFVSLFLCLSLNKVYAGPPPLPPLPSQEELDRLNELGRQNMLKYGTGGSAPIVTPKPSSSPITKLDDRYAFDTTQSAVMKFEEKNDAASNDAEMIESSASELNNDENTQSFIHRLFQSILTRIFSFFK